MLFATRRRALPLLYVRLIDFYRTGEEHDRIAYDIAWVNDQESRVDTINGFVEVYMDARGVKGSWEALVYIVNARETHKIETLAANAQWFEDHMPFDARYRKSSVLGVTAKAIEVVFETGDSGPLTPIGINLPNDQQIREHYGSKSVSLFNINEGLRGIDARRDAHRVCLDAGGGGACEAMGCLRARSDDGDSRGDRPRIRAHGGGPRLAPPVAEGTVFSGRGIARRSDRAVLRAADPKLADLGIVRAEDHGEIVQTAFEYYARNALVQLSRIREGTTIEEDHMRNRQLIRRVADRPHGRSTCAGGTARRIT
jgi:dipeptidyl-peptidase-3